MASLSLENISKIFPGGVAALCDVSFSVADGELVVLAGPSAAGKTTILRLIAGLERPTEGVIRINGHICNDVPARDRDVAFVFQRPTVYPHLTVRRNLSLGIELREKHGWFGWMRSLLQSRLPALQDRIMEAARLLELEDVLDRKASQLSGGQQQRVALGRAVVRRPALFLLDEPLSHLDGRLRATLRRQLHLLHRRLLATMIYVTHDPVEAMILADRVVVLQAGTVQQVGSPLAVYHKPSNRFVAGFFGWPPMNLLAGRLTWADKGPRLRIGGMSWPMPLAASLPQGEREVTLGIRPPDVRLGAAQRPTEVLLTVQVKLIEPLGNVSLVTLERDGLELTGQLDGRAMLSEGQTIDVVIDMDRVHWFDTISGTVLTTGRPEG
jgi:multiple sugar transport system ATP-binding protein